jgi:hypothetical protein
MPHEDGPTALVARCGHVMASLEREHCLLVSCLEHLTTRALALQGVLHPVHNDGVEHQRLAWVAVQCSVDPSHWARC